MFSRTLYGCCAVNLLTWEAWCPMSPATWCLWMLAWRKRVAALAKFAHVLK